MIIDNQEVYLIKKDWIDGLLNQAKVGNLSAMTGYVESARTLAQVSKHFERLIPNKDEAGLPRYYWRFF